MILRYVNWEKNFPDLIKKYGGEAERWVKSQGTTWDHSPSTAIMAVTEFIANQDGYMFPVKNTVIAIKY